MSYEQFDIEDFLASQEFRDWVLSPTSGSDEFWRHWIELHPEKKVQVLKAREIILSLNYSEPEQVSYEERSDLLKSILGSEKHHSSEPGPSWYRQWYAVAATIALILVFGSIILIKNSPSPGVNDVAVKVETIIKENPKGQKSVIHLADGSSVHLNANSSIKYYSDFSDNRFIELTGEAYFEVEKNPENPFIVKSANIYTQALGTSFNVNSKGESISVTLVEGKILVHEESNPADHRLLDPYEKVEYNANSGLSQKSEITDLNEIAWTQGVLLFDQTPITEVVNKLEDWYGVEIQLDGKYQGLSFSSEYKDEYLSNILNTMSHSMNMEYTIDKRNVKLKFK